MNDAVRFADLRRSAPSTQRKKLGAEVHTSEWIPWHKPGDSAQVEVKPRLRTIDLLVARAFGRRRPLTEEVIV